MTTTYHPIHKSDQATMTAMRAMIAAQPRLVFSPEARPHFDAFMSRVPAAENVTFEAGEVGGISGWWCRPTDAIDDAVVLFLHGGAYIVGSAEAFRHFASQVATRAQAATFVPEYRLAPENPFPAAIEDVEAAYRGLIDAGVSRVGLAGDSAGGGLALALLVLMAKAPDASRYSPACAVLLSPVTDLLGTGASARDRAEADPLLTPEVTAQVVQSYLNGQDPRDPRASPLYADLTDLPPVLIHVGEDEVLLDDSRRVAEAIEASNGEIDLHVWEGMIHVFPSNVAILEAAREAQDNIGAFLRRHLAASS